ncbi:lipid A export permease/ATP-binding protein MsbA [Alkalilimnicola sp. S0819]|nr:lipid A export permease/ATP-binding protein MsbA [Alkalilimnicola sp. S0819]KAB7627699.1 lipid A export permease/ATP-binding protein MsbA [Alkalilimnicola sp. S0819]MPQ15793.1 lipid A export permease/ATP-binding protein MsbA [Alkalilimnicola sp. S0819]
MSKRRKEPAAPDMAGPAQVYRRLLRYIAPYWKQGVIAVLAMMVAASTETGFAALIKPMVDGSFVDRDPTMIKLVPLALLGIFILRGLSGFIADYGMKWIARNMISTMRGELFARMLKLPTRFYDNHSSGRLLSKMTYDVEQVARAGANTVTVLIRDGFTILFLMAYMVYLSGYLALIFLLIGPILAAIVVRISKRFRRLSRNIQRSVGELAHVAEEAIEGHAVIKTFGAQEHQQQRFERANAYNRRQFMKHAAADAANTPIVQFCAAVALSVIVYLATLDQVLESVTAGSFVSFIAAMLLLMPPLKRLTKVNAALQQGIAAGQSLFALIDEPSEPDTGRRELKRARGAIVYQDVRFAYEPKKGEVLKGVSLTIEPGETVAFVGRSGSGKTTLVNLLPRFYEPLAGGILLDDHPLTEYPLSALRRQIAIVGQQVTLFDDSIAANIAFGRPEAVSEEEIREALRLANALEFVERLPAGLQTQIGENGVLLSGGQRQRLAIARALIKDAPILVLDEATSALDTESERQIQSALDRLIVGRTTLVIAHRLSTIEQADRIVVLDQGEVVEQGRHEELLARGGHYAALHRLQFNQEGHRGAREPA